MCVCVTWWKLPNTQVHTEKETHLLLSCSHLHCSARADGVHNPGLTSWNKKRWKAGRERGDRDCPSRPILFVPKNSRTQHNTELQISTYSLFLLSWGVFDLTQHVDVRISTSQSSQTNISVTLSCDMLWSFSSFQHFTSQAISFFKYAEFVYHHIQGRS